MYKFLARCTTAYGGVNHGVTGSIHVCNSPHPYPDCALAEDGSQEFVCPVAAAVGQLECVGEPELCNGRRDCSGAEDEDPVMCLFYRVVSRTLRHLHNSIV